MESGAVRRFPNSMTPLIARGNLLSWFGLPGLAANPFESPSGDQAHNQEVASAKARRVFPGVSVFVRPLEGDVEHETFFGLLAPDAGAHGTMADFVNGLVVRCTDRGLIFHI